MYRGEALACPACGGTLDTLAATLPIAGCDACGGAWLGPDAAVHVMRGLRDTLEHELAEASVAVSRRSHVLAQDSGARECPQCGSIMGRLAIAGVIVDSCPAHGTWFDRNEVDRVVHVCGILRNDGPVSKAAFRAWDGLVHLVDSRPVRNSGNPGPSSG